jgi:hypothetical protein
VGANSDFDRKYFSLLSPYHGHDVWTENEGQYIVDELDYFIQTMTGNVWKIVG